MFTGFGCFDSHKIKISLPLKQLNQSGTSQSCGTAGWFSPDKLCRHVCVSVRVPGQIKCYLSVWAQIALAR